MARAFLHPRAAGSFRERFLRERASVFTGATWTTPLFTDVACALLPVDRQPATTAQGRAELAAIREFRFDPDVVVPEFARIEVAGHLAPNGTTARWQPRAGTFVTETAPDGTALYKRCDLTRAT
jgi:hypothetical protein